MKVTAPDESEGQWVNKEAKEKCWMEPADRQKWDS